MLGGLARYLLLAGRDCFYRRNIDDPNLANLARTQNRILLTKDQELLERFSDHPSFRPPSKDPEEQFRQVVDQYNLTVREEELFTRCPECNLELEEVDQQEVHDRIPKETSKWLDEYYRCPHCDGDGGRACGRRCADELEDAILEEGPETVAAFVAEPVTGAAAAAATPHDGYFERIREICDEYDVLFVVDEVMAGFGRTGENFAIEHWDVTPDIITSAKGMSGGYSPIGGTMPHRRVAEVFEDVPDGFQHGHTYCFNPASAAIGNAVLEYMRDHDLVANARDVGAYLRERCEEFYEYDFVGDVRGTGLMLGVEFVGDRETKEPLATSGEEFQSLLFETGLDEGVLTYPSGGHVEGQRGDHTLITPPLSIDRDAADELVERMHATFDRVEAALDQ